MGEQKDLKNYDFSPCFGSLEARAVNMSVFMWPERNPPGWGEGGAAHCVSGSAMQGLWESYELSSYVMSAQSGQT